MCIMGRSFAIKQTVSWGFRVALMRDLVDTMYSPLDPPYVEHDLGNAIMTSFIEKFWAPSISFYDFVEPGHAPGSVDGDPTSLKSDDREAVGSEGSTMCTDAQGRVAPCGPGNAQCNASAPPPLPRYHVMDYSCAENDPNGPCYDEHHGVYRESNRLSFVTASFATVPNETLPADLFYQDHLGIPPHAGPVFGHVVSRDLVHWARVGVGIWNDQT